MFTNDIHHMHFKHHIIFLSFFCSCLSLLGQDLFRENEITWEDFINLYAPTIIDEDGTISEEENDMLDYLLQLTESPININTATRSVLLQLPFVNEEQADSILSYRKRVGAFVTLGELQFIAKVPQDVRQYMTLFTYVGEPLPTPGRQKGLFTDGNHEVIVQAEIPFYTREGYHKSKANGDLKAPGQYYLGEPIKHSLRYKFTNQNRLLYGITLEQDAGEPFAQKGNSTYDFISAHVQWSSKDERTNVCLGDYKVSLGQGLLIGEQRYGGRMGLIDQKPQTSMKLRAHRGTDEINYMRGAAITHEFGKWTGLFFASWRAMDARMDGDTVRSILTSGQHRTPTEISRKNTLEAYLIGGALQYTPKRGHTLSLNAYSYRYSAPIAPEPKAYNSYYFRGETCGGVSTTYSWKSKRWSGATEVSSDHDLNSAAVAQIHFDGFDNISLSSQLRWFSNAYIAPYAHTLSASSRTQGERGATLGWKIWNLWGWRHKGYVDVYQLTSTTYKADKNACGGEVVWQSERQFGKRKNLMVRYKYKTKEERITGYKKHQFLSLHRLKLQLNGQTPKTNWSLQSESTCAFNQVEGASWGFIVAGRGQIELNPKLKIGGFGAFFSTDNYETAVYAHEPQLPYTFSYNSFYYRGMRLSAQAEWKPFKNWTLGVKYGITHYLNRKNISSGPQQIKGATKADLQIQIRAKF